ncbi:MFS transporter [Sphingomonas sp. RT2P30]|uniref:MFS transporter n=1 Tax=Parasphingomonas halimpatiens TaxID=3096162 RepID=UPI002FC5D708
MSAAPLAVPPARQLGARSRWSFGVGSIAYGIKDSGFATFLLLFYNQVIGLPSAAVGLAVGAALIVEAFVDPLVGYLSDHTRGKWGRRHPWMYASAIPVALGWWLLWNPPHWEQGPLLLYVFATALMVRVALSTFEIPSSALGPELTSDYDERTRLFSYRYLFGWGGGLVMLFLAYTVFLRPDAAHANGLTNGDGYRAMAGLAAVLMAVSIVSSSIGLHHEIGRLPPAPPRGGSLHDHFGMFGRTIANKGFLILMAAGLCAYTAQGISFALSNYNYQFVWRLAGGDYVLLPLALMVGAGIAFFIAPALTRGGNKARAGAWLSAVNVVLLISPYVLRLLGWFPEPRMPMTLPILLTIWALQTAVGVAAFILGAAMLADVVEESEMRTGRRSEGVFYAGGFFVQKLCGGLGIFFAGQILSLASFPQSAAPGTVSVGTIDRMTICFIVTMLIFYGGAALFYAFFPFGRAEHEARLKHAAARIDVAMEGAIP